MGFMATGANKPSTAKIIADRWRNERSDVKLHYEQEAKRKKALHAEAFPGVCPGLLSACSN